MCWHLQSSTQQPQLHPYDGRLSPSVPGHYAQTMPPSFGGGGVAGAPHGVDGDGRGGGQRERGDERYGESSSSSSSGRSGGGDFYSRARATRSRFLLYLVRSFSQIALRMTLVVSFVLFVVSLSLCLSLSPPLSFLLLFLYLLVSLSFLSISLFSVYAPSFTP